MGLKIQTNIESLQAQRELLTHRTASVKAIGRLSSGRRITSAADDAAGLSIATNMNATHRSLDQATRNANDGISMIQVAEGGMSTTSEILVRLRELAIQASSDTIGDHERGMVNREVHQLRDEISRVSQTTEYNGQKLLSGNLIWPILEVQVGIHADHDMNRLDVDRNTVNTSLGQLGLTGIDFGTKDDARQNLDLIDIAIGMVSSNRATLGALQNRFQSAISGNQIYSENIKAAKSRILDADVAHETMELTKNNILSDAGVSVLAQANQNPNVALKLLS